MKKLLITLLCLFLVCSAVFANGQPEKKSDEPVVLEILISGDTTEGAPMAKAVERFNAEYKDKGIQVSVNEIAYKDLSTQVNNRAKARELPALIKNTTGTLDQFVDLYYPLDETGLDPDDFVLNYCVRNGKFIATALNVTSTGLFINKTVWDKAGVKYPTSEDERWTWDEFKAAVQEVQAKTGIEYGFAIDYSQDRIKTVLYQFGMRMADPNNSKKLTLRSPEVRKGMEFILSLYEDGVSPVTIGTGIDNAQNTFKTGRLAAHLGGNWSIMDYKNNIKDFEFIPVLMPKEACEATMLGGNLLSVFDGTGVEKEAIEFVKWFYEPENYKQYLYDANYLSAVKSLDVEYKLSELSIFQTEIQRSVSTPNDDLVLTIEHTGSSYGNTIRDNFAKVIAGEFTLDQGLERMVQDILIAYPDMTE